MWTHRGVVRDELWEKRDISIEEREVGSAPHKKDELRKLRDYKIKIRGDPGGPSFGGPSMKKK